MSGLVSSDLGGVGKRVGDRVWEGWFLSGETFELGFGVFLGCGGGGVVVDGDDFGGVCVNGLFILWS